MIKIEENLFEIENKDLLDILKERPIDSHKGMFGTVGIIGGSINYSGAIKLANMSFATLRSGVGIARVIVPEKIAFSIMPYLLEQTLFTIREDEDYIIDDIEKATKNLKAIAIGMGLEESKENELMLKHILENFKGSILIDASCLNILSKTDLKILNNVKSKVILTPHLKEFERLSKITIKDIKKEPIKIAKDFAKKHNVILLLKGPTTIITNGITTYLVKRGAPGMATAGSGDVLSGILIGLLGYNNPDCMTVATGAYLAGVAGELAQKKYTDIAMKASDTIENIPLAIKYIRNEKI